MSQNTRCRVVEVVQRSTKCPCDCVPPIPLGPPCPFKSTGGPVASGLQGLLQQSNNAQSDCPLVERCQVGLGNDQLCVFARPGPIDFKSLPCFACSCVPGTCPELAKNVIRSLGFDPMCSCPCPKTVKPCPPPEAPKKPKRRKKDRSKSHLDLSKPESKKSPDEPPSLVPSTIASYSLAAESASGLPSAVHSALATGAAAARNPNTLEAEPPGTVAANPSNAAKPMDIPGNSPKYSAYSGSSTGSLLLEGKGFKIYEIEGEKVLFNYATKNCPLLKCKCSRKDEGSCGCSEWVRLTKYKNCICPGARKAKKAPPAIHYVENV